MNGGTTKGRPDKAAPKTFIIFNIDFSFVCDINILRIMVTVFKMKKDLGECFQDAVEMKNDLTKPVNRHEIAAGDELIGVIRLGTLASLGFVFRQHESGRELLGSPIYFIGDEKLSPHDLEAVFKASLEQKLGDKVPRFTINKLLEFLNFVLLKSDDIIDLPTKSAATLIRDFGPLYGLAEHHFDLLARILSEEEKIYSDKRMNMNLFSGENRALRA